MHGGGGMGTGAVTWRPVEWSSRVVHPAGGPQDPLPPAKRRGQNGRSRWRYFVLWESFLK